MAFGSFVFLLASCGEQEGQGLDDLATENQSINVEVSVLKLRSQTWKTTIQTFGQIEAIEEVEIGVDFTGQVVQVLFEEGDRVEKGQVLAKLDDTESKLRLAQAQEAANRAGLQLEDAERKLSLRRSLWQGKNISKEDLESAEFEAQVAAANHEEALAALGLAEEELSKTEVKSPFDGVVTTKSVEAGEIVLAGGAIAELQNINGLRVSTYVSDVDVNYVKTGMVAIIRLTGVTGRHYTARIDSVGIKANPRTGNFPVKLLIDDPDSSIRPGMAARVRIEDLQLPDQLVIPESALADRGRERVVFVVRNGKAKKIVPRLRVGLSNQLLVIDGLIAGDLVITSNLSQIVDGTSVNSVEATQ